MSKSSSALAATANGKTKVCHRDDPTYNRVYQAYKAIKGASWSDSRVQKLFEELKAGPKFGPN